MHGTLHFLYLTYCMEYDFLCRKKTFIPVHFAKSRSAVRIYSVSSKAVIAKAAKIKMKKTKQKTIGSKKVNITKKPTRKLCQTNHSCEISRTDLGSLIAVIFLYIAETTENRSVRVVLTFGSTVENHCPSARSYLVKQQ